MTATKTAPPSTLDELLPGWARATPAQQEASASLWAMSPDERISAMRAGRLSRDQLFEWARKTPGQVPQLNGEWEFIACHTPEIADAR